MTLTYIIFSTTLFGIAGGFELTRYLYKNKLENRTTKNRIDFKLNIFKNTEIFPEHTS